MALSDTLKAVPDQVLNAVSASQNRYLATVKSVNARTMPLFEKLPESPLADRLPNAVSAVERAFATAEKFLANQKEFSVRLIEAYLPAKPAKATAAASKATKAA